MRGSSAVRAETETNERIKCGSASACAQHVIVIDAGNKTATTSDDTQRHDHETSEARAPLVDDRIVVTQASERASRPLLSVPSRL